MTEIKAWLSAYPGRKLFPMYLSRPRIIKHPSPAWHHGPWQLDMPLKNPRGVGRRHFDTWDEALEELQRCYANPARWPDSDLPKP